MKRIFSLPVWCKESEMPTKEQIERWNKNMAKNKSGTSIIILHDGEKQVRKRLHRQQLNNNTYQLYFYGTRAGIERRYNVSEEGIAEERTDEEIKAYLVSDSCPNALADEIVKLMSRKNEIR